MGIPLEIRLIIHEHTAVKTIYTTVSYDRVEKPTVILVLRVPELAILRVQKAMIAREANPEIIKLARA